MDAFDVAGKRRRLPLEPNPDQARFIERMAGGLAARERLVPARNARARKLRGKPPGIRGGRRGNHCDRGAKPHP